MNLFISQMKSIYNSEFASASPRPAARVAADWVMPIDETSIPAFDGDMDYNYYKKTRDARVAKHALFGMWADNSQVTDVDCYVRDLRKGRF